MRKKLGIMVLVICIIVALIVGITRVTSPVSISEDQQSIYRDASRLLYEQTIADYDKMMKEGQRSFRKESEISDVENVRYTYFTIVDIDSNGVDELILRFDYQNDSHLTNRNMGYGESTFIYTIRDGEVTEVLTPESGPKAPIKGFVPDTWHIGFTHIFKGSSLISRGMYNKAQKDAFYSYQNGILSETPVLEMYRSWDKWYIDNVFHPPEECLEAYNVATNNDEGYELQPYQKEIVKQEQDNGTSDLIKNYKSFIQSQTDGKNYLIYDIDKDELPEIFIGKHIIQERSNIYEIYAYRNGKFIYTGSEYGPGGHSLPVFASYPEGNGVLQYSGIYRSKEHIRLCRLSGNIYVNVKTVYLNDLPAKYYLDSEDIEFDVFLNHQYYKSATSSPLYEGSFVLAQSEMDNFTALYEAFGVNEMMYDSTVN